MQTRKELELLLLGMALHSDTRDSILKEVSPSVLSPEMAVLFECVQKPEKSKPLIEWLEARGAKPGLGRDARQSIIDAIHRMNAEWALKNHARLITQTLKLGTSEQIVNALQAALDTAKELQEVESA